jgi:hypothetical protein
MGEIAIRQPQVEGTFSRFLALFLAAKLLAQIASSAPITMPARSMPSASLRTILVTPLRLAPKVLTG